MAGVINLLRDMAYTMKGEVPETGQSTSSPEVRPLTRGPQVQRIDGEALFGVKDGYLVVSIDHQFSDIPNWVEWDAKRKTVKITQTSGDVDEVYADIREEYVDALQDMKKVLLVSDNNTSKIVHYVPFLARS